MFTLFIYFNNQIQVTPCWLIHTKFDLAALDIKM